MSLYKPGPEIIKLFSCSTQLSMKFILLKSVKMPTIVGILTFISMINIPSKCFKQDKLVIFQYFTFYEQLNFVLSWVEHDFFFITSWPDHIQEDKQGYSMYHFDIIQYTSIWGAFKNAGTTFRKLLFILVENQYVCMDNKYGIVCSVF